MAALHWAQCPAVESFPRKVSGACRKCEMTHLVVVLTTVIILTGAAAGRPLANQGGTPRGSAQGRPPGWSDEALKKYAAEPRALVDRGSGDARSRDAGDSRLRSVVYVRFIY